VFLKFEMIPAMCVIHYYSRTIHIYLFLALFMDIYLSFLPTVNPAGEGGGRDATSFEYCPLPAGVYSCRSGSRDKPTQRDTDRPLTACKGEKFISKSQFASLNLLKPEVNVMFKN
jgi:hypothetical protein